VQGDGSAATVMLGLPGFVLVAVSEVEGELEQAVETAEAEEFCRGCGARAVPHGRRPVRVRDLPTAGRPVTLIWVKRVWRCAQLRCAAKTWSETSEHIRPRASLTERARAEACRRVGEDGHDVAAVAVEYGVGWHTIMRAVRDHGRPLVEDPTRLAGVAAVVVDETAFLAATGTHPTEFVTGIVALNGRPRLLDVVPGRSGKALSDWVSEREQPWRNGVTMAALDPFRGYATPRCASSCPPLFGCWTFSTSPGSGWPPSTRSAAGSSRRRCIGAATSTTRSTGSGDCCAGRRRHCPSGPGPGWRPALSSATRTAR
jgi:transposase